MFGLSLLCAAGFGAYLGSLYGPNDKQFQANGTKQIPGQGYKGVTGSLSDIALIPGGVERALANPPPKTGQDHEKRDLAAQESMAVWAFYMTLLAGVTALVTFIGTVLIWRQVSLTREAVEDTSRATRAMRRGNKIASNAQRPWISIDAQLLTFDVDSRRNIKCECNVIFKNTGQMVAENFYAKVHITPMRHPFMPKMVDVFNKFESDIEERDAVVIPGETYEFAVQTHRVTDYLPWRIKAGLREDCYLMVLAMSRYRLPGEKTWRVAMKGFSIGENNSPVDNRHLIKSSIDNLFLEVMVMKPLGASRAT